jgi:hypothetical protein
LASTEVAVPVAALLAGAGISQFDPGARAQRLKSYDSPVEPDVNHHMRYLELVCNAYRNCRQQLSKYRGFQELKLLPSPLAQHKWSILYNLG